MEDFAKFDHLHTVVIDNATTVFYEEFQALWRELDIIRLTRALYHPVTYTAA